MSWLFPVDEDSYSGILNGALRSLARANASKSLVSSAIGYAGKVVEEDGITDIQAAAKAVGKSRQYREDRASAVRTWKRQPRAEVLEELGPLAKVIGRRHQPAAAAIKDAYRTARYEAKSAPPALVLASAVAVVTIANSFESLARRNAVDVTSQLAQSIAQQRGSGSLA